MWPTIKKMTVADMDGFMLNKSETMRKAGFMLAKNFPPRTSNRTLRQV
jgi:hypothetical protein